MICNFLGDGIHSFHLKEGKLGSLRCCLPIHLAAFERHISDNTTKNVDQDVNAEICILRSALVEDSNVAYAG